MAGDYFTLLFGISVALWREARLELRRIRDAKDISGAASHYTYTWLSLSGADPSDILVGTAGGGAYIGHDNDLAR